MQPPPTLSAREREVAGLLAEGLTNRQIATRLFISERTVDAHVQNILNKLGASNRAQAAAWFARAEQPVGVAATVQRRPSPADVPTTPPKRPPTRRALRFAIRLAAYVAILASVSVAAFRDNAPRPYGPDVNGIGTLLFAAGLKGDGVGFTPRTTRGDPQSTAVAFVPGAIELTVLGDEGYCEFGLSVSLPPRYFTRERMRVSPGSAMQFWLMVDGSPSAAGEHVVELATLAEELLVGYHTRGGPTEPLSGGVGIDGLQQGRTFTLGVRVDPPTYEVYLDGNRVIAVNDSRGNPWAPRLAIFGLPGSMVVSSVEIYSLA